jgi:hypothetical protein
MSQVLPPCLTANSNYDEETAVVAPTDIFRAHGLPRHVRMDRDARLVGSWTIDGFPSALVRYLLCLGIQVDVCPPHRPDLKPYVERFNRTVTHECLPAHLSDSLEATGPILATFKRFNNYDRPHQGDTCLTSSHSRFAVTRPRCKSH